MFLNPLTLRGQLSLMIALMGGIGLVSAIFIINLFVDHIIEDQAISTLELIKQETITQTEKQKKNMEGLGLRIQRKPEFRKAILNNNEKIIQSLIDEEFSLYYITTKILVVNKIYAFDKNFQLLAQSGADKNFNANTDLCSQLILKAKNRMGSNRLKTIGSYCYFEQHTFDSIIIPIGTLSPIGYLQIISNPRDVFKEMEKKLSMPLQIQSPLQLTNYQSKKWRINVDENILSINHSINDISNMPAINVFMQKDITRTRQSFSYTRMLIIIVISFITIIAIILFLFIFEKSMLKPLNKLSDQLSLIKNSQESFGVHLALEGAPEIIALTENFNSLTSKLSRLYQDLEKMAFTDQLTTLPNRSRLQEILYFHVMQTQRNGTPFAFFMMDLDRFKSVNDTLGHHAGDILLKQVSERLNKLLRKSDYISNLNEEENSLFVSDVIARLGGDEFAAILPDTNDVRDIIHIAKKILTVIQEPFIVDQHSFSVGISIGIVICPLHANETEQLMQYADIAMYKAKVDQSGFSIFNSELKKQNQQKIALDADLRKAIRDDDLSLVYQPKIDLKSKQIIGVETLLRWTHNRYGFIPPDQFIPMAEKSDLINDITDWVICHSFIQKAQWQDMGISINLALNLSAKNLLCRNLVPNIKRHLLKNKIAPESIYLELTETAIMSDADHAIIVMRQLYDMGMRISIDDFGTGHSSLSYLKELPIDEIKIDQSFVTDMENNYNDAIIVQSTIDLAHNMGLRVVAEGVENGIVLDELSKRNCDLAQGYYMAKPMNNDDFMQWLVSSPWGIGNLSKKVV